MDPNLASRLRSRLRAGLLTAAGALLCLAGLVPPARANSDSLSVTITPRDIWPPSAVTDLMASPGAEGQMMLQWTAPDSNNYNFPMNLSSATAYQIRIATFSVTSIGGSTTTWWNSAMDVTALPAPAVSATPPVPAFPGTTQYLLLNQLWPGVTYYAMMISSDEAGNFSGADLHSIPPAVQASTLIYDAPPPPPLNLSVVQASSSSFSVSWSSVTAYDLDYYKIYFDSVPPYDFTHATTTFVVAPTTSTLIAGLNYGTYIFKVTAVDRGQPRYPGVALESVSVSSVTVVLKRIIHQAQAPYGIALTTASYGVGLTSATLRWMPVVRFADMTPFAISSAPTSTELSGYSVFRSTTWIPGVPSSPWIWNDVADVSTATLTWTDLASTPQSYYYVSAQNDGGASDRSVVRTPGTQAAYLVASDNMSFYQVNAPQVQPIEGANAQALGVPTSLNSAYLDSAYLINVSSRPQDLGSLNGRVLKSIEFDAYMGGHLLSPTFAISQPGLLSMHYDVSASSLVTPSSFSPKSVASSPQNMSVYWFNGVNWVQLYGTLDTISQTMMIQTKFFGQYQLRSVERTGGFSFNMAGVSNRYLTPNGDGKNDNVVFTFDNPKDSAVTAKIFDLRGRVVAANLPPGPVNCTSSSSCGSLIWDGTSGGRSVPSGVYIYQIQAEGQSFSGTLVIVK